MKAKITIVEDNDDLRNLMRLLLQTAGYEVTTLSTGKDVYFNTSDLYFIDLNLGDGSGLELCKELKSQKHNGINPVIIIVSANPDLRQLATEVCADDILSKPFTGRELLGKVSEYFPQALVA